MILSKEGCVTLLKSFSFLSLYHSNLTERLQNGKWCDCDANLGLARRVKGVRNGPC